MSKLLQRARQEAIKATTTAVIAWDDTIPQNTEGLEIISLAFTPVSATSTLYIKVESLLRGYGTIAIFVDSTADALAAIGKGTNTVRAYPETLSYTAASGSTSARTYKVRIGQDTATLYNYPNIADDNGGTAVLSNITILEVEA